MCPMRMKARIKWQRLQSTAKNTGRNCRVLYKCIFDDIKSLNIETPEIVVKATEHIRSMIEFVVSLVEKGYAYETSDGIYLILKVSEYGKLSRINLEDQMAGARVSVNDEKRHPADFAVWKKAPKEHIMQ